ncbi:MAG: hypothetical protein DRP45_06470 [Candidatus Zixiibacteriota bacterium]|nr:MAG: hypothetical protein DRP45_06470 [candidate division Zixibacteria bacterium]
MEFRLNTNLSTGQAVLGINSNLSSMFSAMEKLASGRSINSATDSPAGLIISQQLQSQIGSLNQEIDNLSSNISKYETVSSSLGELRAQISDLRSLAIGAANEGFNSESAQEAYATAADSLVSTFNRTVANASFNGSKTLDGSEGSLASISEITDVDLSDPEAAAAAIETIDAAAREIDAAAVDVGSTQKYELESRRASLQVTKENLTAAEASLSDTDYGVEMSNYVGSMIRSQAAIAMLSHSLMSGKSVVSLFGS